MFHLSFVTPCGLLTIHDDGEAVLGVGWGGLPGEDASALTREARDQIAAYFAGDRRAFSLPLAPAGTAFQRRVWAEIARIAFGETATYGGLALALGSGPRAIASACARNPLPLVIPCHRVLAAGGRLGGYSGGNGVETKRVLLRLEGPLATLA